MNMWDSWEDTAHLPNNRLSPEERYKRDPTFATLVTVLEMQLHQGNYTPTELREACILAAIRQEERTIQRRYFIGADYGRCIGSAR
jgi:hypothetical protein